MTPAGEFSIEGDSREALLEHVCNQAQTHGITAEHVNATHVSGDKSGVRVHIKDQEDIHARGAIIAIGRSGNFRRMNIPGEDSDKVSNRLHDPQKFAGKKVCVVGGGDSACEAAIAISEAGGEATLVYRGAELTRPKPENAQRITELASAGKLNLRLGTQPTEITSDSISLMRKGANEAETIANDNVLSLIGREAPLDFFRRSGIRINGEHSKKYLVFLVAFSWALARCMR